MRTDIWMHMIRKGMLAYAKTKVMHMIRKGMLAYAKTKVDEYDLDKEETRDFLQQKAQDNEDKTLELVVAAVKSGSTIQQARVGAWR
jgi:hypothetical protein